MDRVIPVYFVCGDIISGTESYYFCDHRYKTKVNIFVIIDTKQRLICL